MAGIDMVTDAPRATTCWSNFSRNMENTPLIRHLAENLNIDQDRNDETRNVENFDDGDSPVSRSKYDRQLHTHHNFCAMCLEMMI